MRGFSKAIIAGNLTRDPELRTTPSGANVCGFSVAVNRVFKGSDGQTKDEVSYIDCTAWGKQAETLSQYAKKGTGILVSGRLSQRSWEDKNGGGKRSRTEIVVEDFNFLGGNNSNGNGSSSSAPASSSAAASEADVPDDIPDEIDLSEVPF